MPKTANGSMEHELQELIQNFSNHLPYRIYIKDTERRFVYCNTVMIRSLGRETLEEVKGKSDEDFFSASHLREAIKAEEELLDPKGPSWLKPREEIETWKDGRLTRVITEKHAWIGKNGKRKGIIGYSHPIDLRQAAKMFPGALDRLGTVAGAYSGTYLTKLKRGGSKRQLQFDQKNTWMDQVFKETFPGRTLHERMQMIEPADRNGVFKFLEAAKNRGLGYHDSVTFRALGKREIRATGVVYKDKLTRQLYFCVEHREVSKGLGRDALSNEILQRFPGFIFVKDRKRRFVYMNQPLLSCFGMKDISELARRGKNGRRPDDKDLGLSARDRRIYERGDRAILDDEKATMHISEDEVIAVTPDPSQKNAKSKKIHVSTIKMPIPGHWFDPDQPKNTRYILGIAWKTNDIFSKLHDKQMLWDTLLANAAEIIYSKTLDGKYQEVSTSFVDLRGWPKADIVGRKAWDVWSENKSEALKMIEEDKKIEQDKKPIHNILRTIINKDGKKMEVRSQKFPILDEAGQIRLILGISRF